MLNNSQKFLDFQKTGTFGNILQLLLMRLKVQFGICYLELLDCDCVLKSSGGFKNIANANALPERFFFN